MLVAAEDDTALHRGGYAEEVAAYVMHTERWKEAEDLLFSVFAATSDEPAAAGSMACAAHAPGGGGAFRLPVALFARLVGNAVRAEAALQMGDFATAKKRVADHKAVRAQITPWVKTLPPGMVASWEAREEALLARAEATTKGTKFAFDALERAARAESERPGGRCGSRPRARRSRQRSSRPGRRGKRSPSTSACSTYTRVTRRRSLAPHAPRGRRPMARRRRRTPRCSRSNGATPTRISQRYPRFGRAAMRRF